MVPPSEPSGITERWFARAARAGGVGAGPLSGSVSAALLGLGSAAVVVAFLLGDVRAGAVIFTVPAALLVGSASARAALPGVSAARRAWVLALMIVTEGVVIVAAALWAREHQDLPGPLAIGFLALSGALLLSYARTRVLASAGMDLADGPWGIGAREVRLVLLAIGFAVGQPYWALALNAVLAHGAVVGHLARLRATLRG